MMVCIYTYTYYIEYTHPLDIIYNKIYAIINLTNNFSLQNISGNFSRRKYNFHK